MVVTSPNQIKLKTETISCLVYLDYTKVKKVTNVIKDQIYILTLYACNQVLVYILSAPLTFSLSRKVTHGEPMRRVFVG